MRTASFDWTDDVIARLRALWAEGWAAAEIGRRIGVGKSAVTNKVHRLGLEGRPSPIRRPTPGFAPRASRRKPPVPTLAELQGWQP